MVNDVDFDQIEEAEPDLTELTRLVWLGARHPGYAYLEESDALQRKEKER